MPQPLASPEEAAAYPYTEREREFAQDRFTAQAVGSPETVRQQLTGLLERTRADELMLTTMVYDLQDRIRSTSSSRTRWRAGWPAQFLTWHQFPARPAPGPPSAGPG